MRLSKMIKQVWSVLEMPIGIAIIAWVAIVSSIEAVQTDWLLLILPLVMVFILFLIATGKVKKRDEWEEVKDKQRNKKKTKKGGVRK